MKLLASMAVFNLSSAKTNNLLFSRSLDFFNDIIRFFPLNEIYFDPGLIFYSIIRCVQPLYDHCEIFNY